MSDKVEKIITADAEQLAAEGAEIFCKTAKEAVARQGHFTVAFSGGSTPRAMNILLAQEPYLTAIPWGKTHIFMVDERMVSFDHPDSNFGTAQKDCLNGLSIPQEQLHPMPVMEDPEECAARYQAELESFFKKLGSNDPVFDLILLGIGKDGHTASLFPGHLSLEETRRWVLSVKGGQPEVFRLTLTYAVLNRARHILFLASGSAKAAIVQTLFENTQTNLPASKIRPLNGKVTWLLDRTAASLLT